jgi:hypothetical protein
VENNLKKTEIDARIEQLITETFARYDSVFRALAHYDTIPIEKLSSYKSKGFDHFDDEDFDSHEEIFKNLV